MQGRKTEGEERPKEKVARSRKQTKKKKMNSDEFCMEKCAHAGDSPKGMNAEASCWAPGLQGLRQGETVAVPC